MGLTAAFRRLVASAALLAVAAASLLPAVAHAFGTSTGTKWTEVCTSAGPMKVEVPADGPGIPLAPKASDFEHCPACALHAPTMAPPPSPVVLPASPTGEPGLPPLFLASPRPLFAWAAAQPRAPPLAS